MADMGEEMSCIHKNNCDQRLELTKQNKQQKQTNKYQAVQTLNLFKDRIV